MAPYAFHQLLGLEYAHKNLHGAQPFNGQMKRSDETALRQHLSVKARFTCKILHEGHRLTSSMSCYLTVGSFLAASQK